jgi:hypothetical protein
LWIRYLLIDGGDRNWFRVDDATLPRI